MGDTERDLPSEHVFQQPDDSNCGPSTLEMVYRFKGIDRDVPQILKDFHFGPKGELTYPPQLARDLQRNGVKTNLLISSPSVVSPAWSEWNNDQLIDALKDWVTLNPEHEKHVLGLHTLFYLQEGGSIDIHSYAADDWKQMLDRKSLLIVGVDEVWLWGHRFKEFESEIDDMKGKSDGHFVLVTGYTDNRFSVLDPYPTGLKNRNGQYEVEQSQLINASLLWEGMVVEVINEEML